MEPSLEPSSSPVAMEESHDSHDHGSSSDDASSSSRFGATAFKTIAVGAAS
eukprot:CAMPEP_0178966192 /NCGR_PEP_ID=MMETSP0789-20121207/16775_1 /TAXON_ID=3005 /ORGANISM="Rhizosolenia setigera, Strain CCMP 1694" /LENGTH=50 /DNA_ID=CAMNT_0020651409 /DNA_START=11 /DNA_END=159 /DNA_ORIENTATION=+